MGTKRILYALIAITLLTIGFVYFSNVQVHIIRHGQTDWNLKKRVQGFSDIPLNAKGLNQAKQLAKAFEDRTIDVLYSSDLKRAHRTAQELAKTTGAKIITDERLRGRNYGKGEGLSRFEAEKFKRDPNSELLYGLESRETHFARIADFMESVVRIGTRDIYIVAHTGLVRRIYGDMGIQDEGRARTKDGEKITKVGNCSETTFSYNLISKRFRFIKYTDLKGNVSTKLKMPAS